MYLTGQDLLEACLSQGKSIASVSLSQESQESGLPIQSLKTSLEEIWAVMKESAYSATRTPTYSLSGLTGGNAHRIQVYTDEHSYTGSAATQAIAYALSVSEVNANMGRIVAAPTAGAAGILPGALVSSQERFDYPTDTMINSLVVASAIGAIITANATVSGAEGGCQVECGSAAAMAAAALASLQTDDPQIPLEAASFALISVLGLVCDPVGGLVEFPCALRNASGVMNALTSADLALAGLTSLVPFDEVVQAMYHIGQSLPYSLRETALGGLAATESGKAAYQACQSCSSR